MTLTDILTLYSNIKNTINEKYDAILEEAAEVEQEISELNSNVNEHTIRYINRKKQKLEKKLEDLKNAAVTYLQIKTENIATWLTTAQNTVAETAKEAADAITNAVL